MRSRWLRTTLTAAALLLIPAMAQAQVGIRGTRHDLSSSTANAGVTSAQNQICIFCHTPHKAQSTQLMWNKVMTAATTLNWGTDLDGQALTLTSFGTTLPTTLRSSSRRCLSCHDGSVAIGDVSNAGGGLAGNIAVSGTDVSAAGMINNAAYRIGSVAGTTNSYGGNHPISIPYAGETGYNSLNSAVPVTAVTAVSTSGYYWSTTTTGCESLSGVCTTATGADALNGARINLIPQTVGGTANVGVECASCHEPHNKYTPNVYFLRVDVANASSLCRSCHKK